MFNFACDTNSKEHENLRQEMQEIRKALQNLSKTLETHTAVPLNPETAKPETDTPVRKGK
jgi:hypothetical protein